MNATMDGMTTSEKSELLTTVARQHAEAAICHYCHAAGVTLTDRQYDAELALLTDNIWGGLVALHARRVAPEKRTGAYRVADLI